MPTVLSYDRYGNSPLSWGFQAEELQHDLYRDYCSAFKTYLDPNVLRTTQSNSPRDLPSEEEVRKWTQDYLHNLHAHVEKFLSGQLPSNLPWSRAAVEFIFSVPTTWDTAVVDDFHEIIKSAGWGAYRSHNTMIGITEAEAAAVYIACEAEASFSENEVILVCDAGGGTSDLSILHVQGAQRGVPDLKQLSVVRGGTIGSAQIYVAFAERMRTRLKNANEIRPIGSLHGQVLEFREASWTMAKSAQFQDAKCAFGSEDDIDFSITVPDLPSGYHNDELAIYDGKTTVDLKLLLGLFDSQLEPLLDLIGETISAFAEESPSKHITQLVLSGGLGSSLYVQQRIRKEFCTDARHSSLSYGPLTLNVSPEPQLAVCKGVCHDRLGWVERRRSVLSSRCCRASYGTQCKILYDPKNKGHKHLEPVIDPLDGKKYIKNGVEWFIRR